MLVGAGEGRGEAGRAVNGREVRVGQCSIGGPCMCVCVGSN